MKKTVFFTTLHLLFVLISSAQEQAIAIVHYRFKHINDTMQMGQYLRDEVATYLGKHSSYYASYSGIRANEEMEQQMSDPNFDGNLVLTKNSTPITRYYFFDNQHSKAKEIVHIAGDLFSTDSDYPEQKWVLTSSQKVIGGYTCQKATTHFKGRDYVVWFTTELPFAAGPWKLRGLPGLILDARDTKEEVVFEYAGFDKLENSTFLIGVPDKAYSSTPTEVKKLLDAFRANPQAYLEAKSRTARSTPGSAQPNRVDIHASKEVDNTNKMDPSRIKSMNVKTDESYKPSKTTNNPIERTP